MLWQIPLVSDGALTPFSFFNILVLAWINNSSVQAQQIFDCASVVGWYVLSHDATTALLVSQRGQTDIDLYHLHPKSIIKPQRKWHRKKESQGGNDDNGCVCVWGVCVVYVLFQCFNANLLSLFWTCLYSTKLKLHDRHQLHFVTISKPRL